MRRHLAWTAVLFAVLAACAVLVAVELAADRPAPPACRPLELAGPPCR